MTAIEAGSVAEELLTAAQLAWLTTVRADGQPQSSYVWFHFDGQDLVVFSEAGAGKVRNIATNPKVSFHLDGDGRGGRVLTIDADAVLVEDLDPGRVEAYLQKYDDPIRHQLNTTPEAMRATYRTVLQIVPQRIRTW